MIYRLVEDGYCIAEFRRENTKDYCLEGELYRVDSWKCDANHTPLEYSFISNVYIKFDACSHFHFLGEDYIGKNTKKENRDGYYHICGDSGYLVFMKAISFAYLLATKCITNFDDKEFKNILSLNLLKDCTIEEIKEESDI